MAMDAAFSSGPNLGSDFGSEQKRYQRAEVDTSAPFASVMEAVNRFGGIGFWKPHAHKPPQANNEEAFVGARVEDQTTQSQNNVTREILKEIEATKTRFEELKVKLRKEEVKVNTDASENQNNNGDVQVDEAELSKTEILKRVEEATKEVMSCTRVLEEALSRVEAARLDSHSEPTMSIGQILSRKLVLAAEHSEKTSSAPWKVSLAQILNKPSNREKRVGNGDGNKGVPTKRMKFGFGGISFLAAKSITTRKQSR